MFKTLRAGAIASVAMILASFLGAGIGGATAQDQAGPQAVAMDQPISAATGAATQEPIRFVATEVVQPLPPELPSPDQARAASLHELVATVRTIDDMSAEMTCLAQAIYFESRGEDLAGQLAVAEVIINRSESPRFPDDYCSVVTQRSQFSFVRNGSIPAPDTSSQAWQRAKAIAQIAHQELWESEASDALYFHAKRVNPGWASRLATTATIDSHIFYR